MNIVPKANGVRAALLTGAALALSMPLTTAQAQDETIEEIITTGSRIARDEFSSSSPIAVVEGEDVTLSGVVSIDEYLKDVPSFTGYQMGSQTNNGSDQGAKKIDLRGLGFERTLVLINGRRTIGDAYNDGAVDLNAIPEIMIKRVEVLKDGASTIYGSDALAGVVNIILHDDFEGLELMARYGEGMEDGQAPNSTMGLLGGINGDRGRFVGSISMTNQDEMLQIERPDWAYTALYPLLQADGTFLAGPSGSSNSRTIRVPGVGSRTFDTALGVARPYNPSTDFYDYSPINALTQPNERWQGAFNGEVDINDSVEGFLEFMYTRRVSQLRLAPDASFNTRIGDFLTPNNGLQDNDYVPASNPFNPYGVNAAGPDETCGTADDLNPDGVCDIGVRINRRFVESGGRLFRSTADTYRMVVGVRGELFNDTIDWDVAYTYAENETLQETINYGRFDRWAIAVDPVACAADSGCSAAMGAQGVLNPFDDYGTITPSQMAYLLTGSLKDAIGSKFEMGEINFSGEVGEMGGGAVGWAAGYQHRTESGYFKPDEFLAANLTTGGASDPLQGKYSVDEFYGEVLLPITDAFDVSASVRFSDYDTVGNATTYKIGGDWAITDTFRLRGTFATGFRAPNISEINSQNKATFPLVDNICEFADDRLANGDITQAMYDNCETLLSEFDEIVELPPGSWAGPAGEQGFAWQALMTFRSPEVPLEPEESESYNIGFVWEPTFVDGLRVGVDYWNIEIDEVIGTDDYQDLQRACIADLSHPACDNFDTQTGGPYDLDWYWTYPAYVVVDYGNLGKLTTNGVDVDLEYSGDLDMGAVRGYDLRWNTTFQNEYTQEYPTGTQDLAGTANGFFVYPEVRMSLGASLFGDNWTAGWQGTYIGETDDRLRPCYLTDDCKAEAIFYHNLTGTYTWENITFNLGIRNVTDEDPPRFHSAFNANTEPGTYDVVGRAWFTGFRLAF